MDPRFARHRAACDNATLPGRRIPFRIGTATVGFVPPELLAHLRAFPPLAVTEQAVTLPLGDADALPTIAHALSRRGLVRWRAEAFDVRADPDGPVLSTIDRGALPLFGIQARGVHVNGLVRDGGRTLLWVARRAANKALDPGKLDHIVAGGVPAGLTPEETLVKEAAEEAAIPADLVAQARPAGILEYAMERPEGLRRDRLHCYDLDLPIGFTPHAADGEVEAFELWPLPDVVAAVRDSDAFKFNVNLVLIDLFRRHGLL
jgi:8-oxo-dGTP pyrophosphatase MutT (NUDIX family)